MNNNDNDVHDMQMINFINDNNIPPSVAHIQPVQPFIFSSNDPTTPAIIFITTIFIGILLSHLNSTLSTIFRIFSELTYPILFFDWILIMSYRHRNLPSSSSSSSEWINNNNNYTFIEKCLRSRFFQFMGRISMSFYMIHFIVLDYTGLSIHYIQTGQLIWDSDLEDGIGFIPSSFIPLVLFFSLFLGWVLTDYFELPIQALLLKNNNPRARSIEMIRMHNPQSSSSSLYRVVEVSEDEDSPVYNPVSVVIDSQPHGND